MTWLSCYRFRPDEVRLSLRLLAYNLGTLWRRLVKNDPYYGFLLAEGRVMRRVSADDLVVDHDSAVTSAGGLPERRMPKKERGRRSVRESRENGTRLPVGS
jgi:hypothetical protein